MPFKDFLIETYIQEAVSQFNIPLIEAINSRVAKAVAAFNNRADDDVSDAGINLEDLADMITALRIVSTRELRSGITADDVGGWNPNSAEDMFDVFSKVPDSPKTKMPTDLAKFFKAISGLAPKIRKQEIEDLRVMLDSDEAVRKKAVAKLKVFNTKLDQLYNKLKTTVKAK